MNNFTSLYPTLGQKFEYPVSRHQRSRICRIGIYTDTSSRITLLYGFAMAFFSSYNFSFFPGKLQEYDTYDRYKKYRKY